MDIYKKHISIFQVFVRLFGSNQMRAKSVSLSTKGFPLIMILHHILCSIFFYFVFIVVFSIKIKNLNTLLAILCKSFELHFWKKNLNIFNSYLTPPQLAIKNYIKEKNVFKKISNAFFFIVIQENLHHITIQYPYTSFPTKC